MLAAALWALSNRANQLVLHAVADLAGSFATTAVNQTTQCAAEAILALGHSLLHATAAIRCAVCAFLYSIRAIPVSGARTDQLCLLCKATD